MSDFLFYSGVFGFCVGILLAAFFSFALAEVLLVLTIVAGLLLVSVKSGDVKAKNYSLVLVVFLLAFGAGLVRYEIANISTGAASEFENYLDEEVKITGVVVEEPDYRANTVHLVIESESQKLLVISDRFGEYHYGDLVEVSGSLKKPESFTTDLGRSFNYPGYLMTQGIVYTIPFAEVGVVGKGEGYWWLEGLFKYKNLFISRIELLIIEPQSALAEGLLLGVKQALGEYWEGVFRQTGIIHIVVLSGYNIALVVVFVRYILSYLFNFRLQLFFGLLAIAAFALTVGLSATVLRASLMASFILLAKFFGRTYVVLRGLFLAGILMLFVNPYLLPFDVGFQLSFLATLGLLLLAPKLEKYFLWVPKQIGLRELFLATLSTQIFVLPILLYQIGEFSVVSVLVNMLVLPMVPIAMLLTFLTVVFSFVSQILVTPLIYLTVWSLSYIMETAAFFASFNFAAYPVPSFSFWLVSVAYLGIFVWYKFLLVDKLIEKQGTDLSNWIVKDEEELRKEIEIEIKNKVEKTDTPVFFR